MSLNKLLAAGHSFAGIRGDKSPYAMRQRLPVFNGTPRFAPPRNVDLAPLPVQGELLPEGPAAVQEAAVQRVIENAPLHRAPSSIPAHSAVPPVARRRSKGWLWYLTLGLFGKRPKTGGDLIQSELSLDKVRVLRNDLADSDLELVIKKKRGPKPPAQTEAVPFSPNPAPFSSRSSRTSNWNELASRLFEIGQH